MADFMDGKRENLFKAVKEATNQRKKKKTQ